MTLRPQLRITALTLVIVIPMMSSLAWAHHSKAHYGNVEKIYKGTLVEYKWRNPHVYLVWDSKDQSGKVIRWIGELGSVTTMIAEGMTKDSLKPGDEIIVNAYPTRTGSPEGVVRRIVKANGTVVVANAPGTPGTTGAER